MALQKYFSLLAADLLRAISGVLGGATFVFELSPDNTGGGQTCAL